MLRSAHAGDAHTKTPKVPSGLAIVGAYGALGGGRTLSLVVPAVLVLVAIIHLLPLVGVLGTGRLMTLYGVRVDGPDLSILLRHRAVLFGLLGAGLLLAAARPELHGAGIVAGMVSVVSFLILARLEPGTNERIRRVVAVDVVALVLLVVAAVVHIAS